MANKIFELSSPAMPTLLNRPAFRIIKLEGGESLSTLYSYTLNVVTPLNDNIAWQVAANIDLKALIGKEMTVTINLNNRSAGPKEGEAEYKDNDVKHRPSIAKQDVNDDNEGSFSQLADTNKREISGIVEKARFVGKLNNQAQYEIVLRPWLCLSELTTDFKIFQNKSVVDILEEVLSEYEFSYEKRLSDTYPLLDFQVQYGETDFAFLQRLMEEWGIYWFFEHKEAKHRLILVDNIGAHRDFYNKFYQTLHYNLGAEASGQDSIVDFTHQEMLTSSRWVTNDYDFMKSRANIMAMDNKPRKTSFNDMELYHWPGDYDRPDIGEQLSRIRMEERGALGTRSTGSGPLRGVVCGCTFKLEDYPLSKANREYLILSSRLVIEESSDDVANHSSHGWQCAFTVQPTSKIYRHPQTIPKPRTHGPQNAIVVGPAGKDIWTDEFGRVKVRFAWDRYGSNTHEDSCWIRVSQAWAGNSFGGIYIPRVGHEVIVDFHSGDPDRPLIIGSLYNNVTNTPWDLPKNATQSGMISRSVNGGRNQYNGVRFEDKPGQEHYWEQAEKDMSRLTKNNESQVVGANSVLNVGANRSEVVGLDLNQNVLGAHMAFVGGAQSLQVGLGHNLTVGGPRLANLLTTDTVNVGGAQSINVGGARLTNVGLGDEASIGGAWNRVVGGAASLTAGGALVISAAGFGSLVADVVHIKGKDKVVIEGDVVFINTEDNDCVSCGGDGGVGLAGLVSLAGLLPLSGLISLPIPLPPLPTLAPPTTPPPATTTPPPTTTPPDTTPPPTTTPPDTTPPPTTTPPDTTPPPTTTPPDTTPPPTTLPPDTTPPPTTLPPDTTLPPPTTLPPITITPPPTATTEP